MIKLMVYFLVGTPMDQLISDREKISTKNTHRLLRIKKTNREKKWIRKQRIKLLIILIKNIFKIVTNIIKLPTPMIRSKLLFNCTKLIKLRSRIKRKNTPSFSRLHGMLIMKIQRKNKN